MGLSLSHCFFICLSVNLFVCTESENLSHLGYQRSIFRIIRALHCRLLFCPPNFGVFVAVVRLFVRCSGSFVGSFVCLFLNQMIESLLLTCVALCCFGDGCTATRIHSFARPLKFCATQCCTNAHKHLQSQFNSIRFNSIQFNSMQRNTQLEFGFLLSPCFCFCLLFGVTVIVIANVLCCGSTKVGQCCRHYVRVCLDGRSRRRRFSRSRQGRNILRRHCRGKPQVQVQVLLSKPRIHLCSHGRGRLGRVRPAVLQGRNPVLSRRHGSEPQLFPLGFELEILPPDLQVFPVVEIPAVGFEAQTP